MVLTADQDRFPANRLTISQLEAEAYNFAIYSKWDSQVYSNDREYLEALTQLPKTTLI